MLLVSLLLVPLLLVPFLLRSQQRRQDTLILHFQLDSYRLRAADRARLQGALDDRKADSISIIGYTDKTGTVAYNQRLSQQRADAAFRYVRRGESRTAPQGHAIGRGVAPTPELSDSDNRRVEIVFYYNDLASEGNGVGRTSEGNGVAHTSEDSEAGRNSTGRDTIRMRLPGRTPPGQTPPTSADTLVVMTPVPESAGGKRDSTQPSAIISLQHINFIVDTPIPTDSTSMILPKYVEQLRRYKDHRLEIDGYVNSIVPLRGTKDPLFVLSVRRAKFIYDYLVNAGFDPGKLTYKGMGNASPINPTPTTREEMNANMRVEIKVF
jgi:outer membrane protein OmpA-like peptidoglycan-associated protein